MSGLTWRRRKPGAYNAAAPINGEPSAFRAYVNRDGLTWRAVTYAYGGQLSGQECRTLAEGKALAERDYFVVEGVNA